MNNNIFNNMPILLHIALVSDAIVLNQLIRTSKKFYQQVYYGLSNTKRFNIENSYYNILYEKYGCRDISKLLGILNSLRGAKYVYKNYYLEYEKLIIYKHQPEVNEILMEKTTRCPCINKELKRINYVNIEKIYWYLMCGFNHNVLNILVSMKSCNSEKYTIRAMNWVYGKVPQRFSNELYHCAILSRSFKILKWLHNKNSMPSYLDNYTPYHGLYIRNNEELLITALITKQYEMAQWLYDNNLGEFTKYGILKLFIHYDIDGFTWIRDHYPSEKYEYYEIDSNMIYHIYYNIPKKFTIRNIIGSMEWLYHNYRRVLDSSIFDIYHSRLYTMNPYILAYLIMRYNNCSYKFTSNNDRNLSANISYHVSCKNHWDLIQKIKKFPFELIHY